VGRFRLVPQDTATVENIGIEQNCHVEGATPIEASDT